MKNQKILILLLSLFTIFLSNSANAQFYGNLNGLNDKLKNAIEKIKKPPTSNNETVDNSLLEVSGSVSQETKWVMINIRKDNYSDQQIIPVTNGLYETQISLQDGAGLYNIELYSSQVRHSNNYLNFGKMTVENTDLRDMSFLLPTSKAQSDDERIIKLVESLTKHSKNDKEAFIAIYKYVTSKIQYDHSAANDGSYANKDYNAVNTLLSSLAVCEGYANLVAAMSRAYGIRAKVIFGQGVINFGYIAPAWNEVFINNKWELVDATWDYAYKKNIYLFMSPEVFARDHLKNTEMKY